MRFQRRLISILIVGAVLTSFAGSGLVHALVPHSHESEVITQQMHAALRHEDKKGVPDVLPSMLIAILASVLTGLFMPLVRERALVGRYENVLKRGVLPHRKFR